MSASEIISTEPATGHLLWRGAISDVNAEVEVARQSWPKWAAESFSLRVEAMRRFANVVRAKSDMLVDIIARETGKPLWDARMEVDAVINRVEISVSSYMERTSQRRIEGAFGARSALRHKPHGVLAVLGPYSMPADIPCAHILPALLAGNAVVFKPSEKTPAVGALLVECFVEAGIPAGLIRLVIGGPDQGKEMAGHKSFSVATNVKVFFCDPHSPWQRGTNENTNGLLRQYFPKGTDLSKYSQSQLDKVALRLNQRPRETLGFETPADKLRQSVASID